MGRAALVENLHASTSQRMSNYLSHANTLTGELVVVESKDLQLVQRPQLRGDGPCINSRNNMIATIHVASHMYTRVM